MKVLFIIGFAACGKSTYINKIRQTGDEVLETGDIVREITSKEQRVFNSNLDENILKHIRSRLKRSNAKRIIIASARSMHIVEDIRDFVGRENVDIIILKTSYKERRKRFEERNSGKDTGMTYDDVLRGDRKLGLDDMILKYTHDSGIDKHIRVVQW